jgi:hypothetical protein
VSDQVVRQHHGALQPRISPSLPVGVGNVQLGDGDGVDLVRGLGHGALHHLLVLVREDRRHCGVLGGLELVMVMVKACSCACACACVLLGSGVSSMVGRAPHAKVGQHMGRNRSHVYLSIDKRLLHAQWVNTSGSSGDGHGVKEYVLAVPGAAVNARRHLQSGSHPDWAES